MGVTTYRIMQKKTVLAEVGSATVELTGLAPWTEYTVGVHALDAAGNTSESGPEITFQTTDETAPKFEEGAAIESSNVTPNSLTLTWPAATDNVEVSGYQLLRNMVLVAETDASTFAATVDGLSPGTEYTFSVRATDPAGNHSANGPTLTVNTTDTEAPAWPNGAAIALSKITPNALTLAWPPASDDVAVAVYRVLQNDVEVAAVSGTKTYLAGLSPWTDYTFSVSAEDGAGNVTVKSLTGSLQTFDTSPPSWAADEVLSVSKLTPNSLTLS